MWNFDDLTDREMKCIMERVIDDAIGDDQFLKLLSDIGVFEKEPFELVSYLIQKRDRLIEEMREEQRENRHGFFEDDEHG